MPKLPNTLVVLPYDPNWITEFERIRVYLMEQIGDLVIEIKHVGSTSVPSLCAKPIIDIVAIMESYEVFPQIVSRLEKVGFQHVGDQGIKEREVFKRLIPDDFMDYHFYIYPKDSEENRRHTRFRTALLRNPQIADEYGKLKTRLISEVNGDRVLYTNSKTAFIVNVINSVDDNGVLRTKKNTFQIRVTGILLHKGKLLIVKQRLSEKRHWSLPSGRLEHGETLEQAAVREIFEESGITTQVERLLYICDVSPMNQVVYITFFMTYVKGDICLPDNSHDENSISDVVFAGIERLTDYGFSEKFITLINDGFPEQGSYMGDKSNIGLGI